MIDVRWKQMMEICIPDLMPFVFAFIALSGISSSEEAITPAQMADLRV